MNIHKKNLWFTLVELVVVITILAILATLSFVSFTWYMSSTRDSKRSVDINNINKSFEITKITNGQVFFPDSNIDVTLSWSLVGNQWDIKQQTLAFLWVSNEAFDPLDNKPYQFFSNTAKTRFQVVSFFENIENSKLAYVESAFANSEYKNRYPFYRGEGLGFILNDNNEPIHWEEAIETAWVYELTVWLNADTKIKPLFSNYIQNSYTSFIVGGQMNIAANNLGVLNPDSCPENFIHVPWNSDLWQPPFCIGQYEASYETSSDKSTLKTLSGKSPAKWINPSLDDVQGCRGNGEGYHIMTFNEWLTIARNIEQQWQNWSTWIAWNWHIKTWNSGNSTTWFIWWDSLLTGASGNISNDDLRKLYLSNGEVIWDFIWNKWELVSPLSWTHLWKEESSEFVKSVTGTSTHENLSNYTLWTTIGTKTLWKDINSSTIHASYWPKFSALTTDWLGSIFEVNSTNSTWFITWWDHSDALIWENGLFSIAKLNGSSFKNVSTRCAYTWN